MTSEKDKCGRTLNLGACNVSCLSQGGAIRPQDSLTNTAVSARLPHLQSTLADCTRLHELPHEQTARQSAPYKDQNGLKVPFPMEDSGFAFQIANSMQHNHHEKADMVLKHARM